MRHALAGGSLAAGRIDAQHDGFHVVVLGSLAQRLHDIVAVDAAVHAFGGTVDDVALGIDDGNRIAVVAANLLLALGIFLKRQQVLAVVVLLEHGTHILLEAEGVDQARAAGVVGKVAAEVVGNGVELAHADAAAGGNVGCRRAPHTADVGANLLAVGSAHVVQRVHLAGALVGAALGTDEVHLHPQLVEEVLVVHHLPANAAEVHHAAGVQAHHVGRRAEVVAALAVGGGIAYDRLVATGKSADGGTQLLERSPRQASVALEQQAAHVLVVGSGIDGVDGVDESHGLAIAEALHEPRGGAVAADTVEVDNEEGVLLRHRGAVVVHIAQRNDHGDQHDEHQQTADDRYHNHAQRRGEHGHSERKGFVHFILFLLMLD